MEIARGVSADVDPAHSTPQNTENDNQGDRTAWNSILEEAEELSCQFTFSSKNESTGKLSKGEKGRAATKPRFSIRNLPAEAESKFSAPSITQLLEELVQKDSVASSSIALDPMSGRRSRRKEQKTRETTRSSTEDDALEQVDNSTSSGEEENDEYPLIPATMADLFQEFFASMGEGEGLHPPARPVFGYSGRLQHIAQRDKDRHSKILKQMQNSYLSGTYVEIMARVLEAKLPVCRCLLHGNAEIDGEKERTIIFNQKMCGNVELDVGNRIRIYPPWKEVRIKEGDNVILCTYFAQIM